MRDSASSAGEEKYPENPSAPDCWRLRRRCRFDSIDPGLFRVFSVEFSGLLEEQDSQSGSKDDVSAGMCRREFGRIKRLQISAEK